MSSSLAARVATALSQVDHWPAVASVGVTDASASLGGIGAINRSFPWASVTKVVTALATLVAVEEGIITLDTPSGPPGSTVRHLLAHASGLPSRAGGRHRPPGVRRVYSNLGFELLGRAVGEAAGMDFGTYVNEGVLTPLGMQATVWGTSAASGATGPIVDLLALGRELLAPTLIDPVTLARATSVAFPGLAGILPGFGFQNPNDWGLGFELRDHKHPHWTGARNSPATFGHFGQAGSFLWVDPALGLACAGLAEREFGPWAAAVWPQLADDLIAAWPSPHRADDEGPSVAGVQIGVEATPGALAVDGFQGPGGGVPPVEEP